MPATLAETIRVADSYALGDPTQPLLNSVDPSKKYPSNNVAGPSRRNDRQDLGNKRREDRPDYRYDSNHVAAVDQEQPNTGDRRAMVLNGPEPG